MKEHQEQGFQFIQTLIQKSWESPEFKDRLVKNPVLEIESITGKKIQGDKKIIVEDQTNDTVIYLNLPVKSYTDELELTEEQLETIAGGLTPLAYAVGFCIGAACTYYVAKHVL